MLAAALCGAAPPKPKQLAVVRPTLHQFEGGPTLPASFEFLPGDTVFLTFSVSGFQSSEKDEVRIEYRIEASDPKGVALAAPHSGKVEAELAPEDKNWLPKARHSVLVPPFASSGVYRLSLAVKDLLSGSQAQQEVNFNVRGRQVEPSDTLVVRNFRFLRGEEDTDPLAVAAYRPGDAVWARFEIIGYKYGPKNRVEVSYGVAVLRPNGEQLYSEPNAAEEKQESFYPQRYVPGILSLKLDPDIFKGEYTIVLSVRDGVGNQTSELRQAFKIE